MKPLRKLTGFIAAAALALTALGQQASAADLKNDPLIRDALNRANFEPGGKYHLFGSRGTVAERTGLMTISPTVTHQIGNLQIRQATIFSNPGYIVRFSGHGHEVHAPFDNHASRSASAKGGSVLNGFTMFSMSWDGYEHHPADGYDGPQGSGYPAPHGARDIYSYVVKGKAQSIKLNPTDTRSTEQRFADRFGNIPKNFSDRANEANKKMLEHNPNLDRWGNAMEFINGVAAGAVNPFLSAGEAVGVGDAVQGVGFGIDLATMAAISPMSADTSMSAVDGLSRLGRFEDRASTAVRNWSAENPNAAETVEAAFNVAAAAKAAKLAKTGAGKTSIGDDFSRSYTCSFAGSTLVKTDSGYKAIADIRVGDSVFAKDEKNGATGYKTVTAQYSNPYKETVYVKISDGINTQTVIANRIHPFFSDGKWIKAESLKAGDQLLSENGQPQTIQTVTIKRQPLKAYNLTVADWHTYFVKGKNGAAEAVWVHNDCPYGKSPRKIDAVINETNTQRGNITSKHTLSSDEALDAGIKYLGSEYKEIGRSGSGVYRNKAGTRQFRIDNNSLEGNHAPNVPHVHLERIDPNKKKPLTNNHILIKD